MKSSMMRPALVLALVLGLAGCGGKAGFTIGGTVNGLQYQGLVLTSNGMDLEVTPPTPPNTAMNFSFPNQISYGDEYAVTVKTQPQHQFCAPNAYVRNSGTAGRTASINTQFDCSLASHTIGGTISGLTADGLVLANGSTGGTLTVAKGATTFTMPVPVTYNVTYGITVQTQPTGLVCSVDSKGTGTMGDQNIADIGVTCVPQT